METGVFCAFSGRTPPDMMAAQVRAIEERGFHCIWVPEHVVLFDEYESRYPYAADGRIGGFSDGIMEPFTALAFVAAHTRKIRLGTSICLVPQRNPVYTAKQVARNHALGVETVDGDRGDREKLDPELGQ